MACGSMLLNIPWYTAWVHVYSGSPGTGSTRVVHMYPYGGTGTDMIAMTGRETDPKVQKPMHQSIRLTEPQLMHVLRW